MKKVTVFLAIFIIAIGSIFAGATPKTQSNEPIKDCMGAFNLTWNMTKKQVEEYGDLTYVSSKAGVDSYLFSPVKPHSSFDMYFLDFTSSGLVEIIAVGKKITTSESGYQLKKEYNSMRDKLDSAYGKHDVAIDNNVSSLWTDYNDWMYALLKGYRKLGARWNRPSAEITLMVTAESRNVGYFVLQYENTKYKQETEAQKITDDTLL